MKRRLLTTVQLATAFNANAEITYEKWDYYKDGNKLITLDFKHDTDKEFKYTNIRITGILNKSKSYLDGINRRWDGSSNNSNWSFLITPSESGTYYKFLNDSDTASPSEFYSCKIREPEPKSESESESESNDSDYWDDDE